MTEVVLIPAISPGRRPLTHLLRSASSEAMTIFSQSEARAAPSATWGGRPCHILRFGINGRCRVLPKSKRYAAPIQNARNAFGMGRAGRKMGRRSAVAGRRITVGMQSLPRWCSDYKYTPVAVKDGGPLAAVRFPGASTRQMVAWVLLRLTQGYRWTLAVSPPVSETTPHCKPSHYHRWG